MTTWPSCPLLIKLRAAKAATPLGQCRFAIQRIDNYLPA
jgi:hypothetical protein